MQRILASVLLFALLVLSGLPSTSLAQNPKENGGGNGKASAVASTFKLSLPLKDGSVRFGFIGDTGTGTDKQNQLADVMLKYRTLFPFEFFLMLVTTSMAAKLPRTTTTNSRMFTGHCWIRRLSSMPRWETMTNRRSVFMSTST